MIKKVKGISNEVETKNTKKPITKICDFFSRAYRRALSLIYPKYIKCMCCGKDLKKQSDIEICPECLKNMEFIQDKCCDKCGAKLIAEENFCFNCQRDERAFDIARSCLVYDGEVKKMIHQLKFSNKPYIARAFAPMMVEKINQMGWKFDKIIPIPLTTKKQKERGYNQSKLLADAVADKLNMEVSTDVLIKDRDTSTQVGLSYIDRKNNLEQSFKVIDKYAVKGNNILLIDDVMTTGATANACAIELKKAKANKVYVLTIAHGVVKLPTIDGEKIQETAKND